VPCWEDRVKDDWPGLFAGFAPCPSSCIACVQDTDRDREALLRLRLLDQSHHCMQGIKQDSLTGSGHVAEQAAFDRIALRAIRGIVGHTNRYFQVVDELLEVFLAQRLVPTVPATAITPEHDRGGVWGETLAITVPK